MSNNDTTQFESESILSNALGVNINIPQDAADFLASASEGFIGNELVAHGLPKDTRGLAQLFESDLVAGVAKDLQPIFGDAAAAAFTKLVNDYFAMQLPKIPEIQL